MSFVTIVWSLSNLTSLWQGAQQLAGSLQGGFQVVGQGLGALAQGVNLAGALQGAVTLGYFGAPGLSGVWNVAGQFGNLFMSGGPTGGEQGGGHLDPEWLAEEWEYGHSVFDDHGYPDQWEFQSSRGGGDADISDYSLPGAKKILETW